MALSDAERARLYRERKAQERDAQRDAPVTKDVTPVTKADEPSVTPVTESVTLMPDGVTPRPQAPKTIEVEPGPPPAEISRSLRTLLDLPWDAPLSEHEEHMVKVHFGYADSEKRTRAERAEVAHRIVERTTTKGVKVVMRRAPDGTLVEEPVGPAGLSLVAFPTQTPGDLTPSPAALLKLEA